MKRLIFLVPFLLLFLLLFLSSCTSNSLRKEEDYFKEGKYVHHVEISIHADKSTKHFNGVWVKKKNGDMLIGLTPFNTTLFKISRLEGNLTVELYNDELKKMQDYIPRFFSLMEEFFHSRDPKSGDGFMSIDNQYFQLKLWIDAYESL